ncbi:lipase 3-like isoform X2 [Panicum virgatum]|uniref:lipase 3-like isoform X2 n=1 Tax=Panicum virgatum TaxID=38727 RepID=UPI0019D5C056|nr:lipase 3-like isoform X2 [Panicum virgatum]
MPAQPPPPAAVPRRRWQNCFSPTLVRDRCYTRCFHSAGLRRAAVPLQDGAVVHLWLPPAATTGAAPLHPVLLLHGFGASATWQWAPFLRPLLAADLAPYVPDLIFFGASSSPAADRSPAYQAACIATAMLALPLAPQRYAVVGVSYGGFVAYHLAHAFPAAVERLVLVAAGVCLEDADLAAGLFAVEDIAEAASLLLPQRPEDLRRLVGLTFCRPPRFMPSCFIRVMCTDNVKEKTELLYALINGRKLSDLPKISQQTLIIWGEQDQVFPLELGLWLKRHLGDTSELVIVKNAGHAINREKPAELCRLIRNYIIDPTVKYREDRKGSWKNVIKRFAGSSLRKVDSSRPLL